MPTYPYGLRGAPSIGGGLPGLPRPLVGGAVNADITGFPAAFMFVRTDQLILVPQWATYARLSATGTGGKGGINSSNAGGGGGGGFAGTVQVKVNPGSPINVRFDGTATIAEALGYRLVAGNGAAANTALGGAGGVGSGGDVNFNGGAGGSATAGSSYAGGGSAASRAGNGVAAANTSSGSVVGAAGTAGSGYFSGSASGGSGNGIGSTIAVSPAQTANSGVSAITLQIGASNSNGNGGDGGGGSGGVVVSTTSNNPGAGFVLIELW